MQEIARYIFPVLEYGFFIFPHKIKFMILLDEDKDLYTILKKVVYKDGTEQVSFETTFLGERIALEKYRDWLMRTLLEQACRKPDERLPEITEEDRKWMNFGIM